MMADDKKTEAAPEEAKAEETEAKKPAAKKAAPKKAAAKKEEPAAKKEAAPAEETPSAEAAAEKTDVPEPVVAEKQLAEDATTETVTPPAAEPQAKARPPRGGRGGGNNRGGNNRGGGRGRGGRDNRRDDDGEDLVEKLVHINRVSKTVKGGKRFGFAALMIVGDGKGRAGFGHGKAREVPEAIQKATAAAKKAMMRVPLRDGRTLHHDGQGRFGAGNVTVRSAPPGTGIIAGGPMRAVFESLGVADVVTKSVGTSNPYNMIRATFEALKDQSSPKSVAARRGMKIAELVQRRGDVGAEEAKAEAEAVTE
ncbi:SSU ribosomal protein S5P [Parasphingopyxis lamellibrachiae]|uniref:Small ribosomal subunit protein uS5 n=1 Tax=Parasphingopyxis lamellibrachiae TaxID=680125 RepID=A0A3D9FFE4_9SPHN|nr:SSU ribosomal protein S5P [Parasphingopyxis lamellibrachiae]